jgi:methylated-DNA-protein-cysteine methyltransferase related protein
VTDYAPFTRRVIEVLRSVPRGRVTCYRDVAAMAGTPQGARQVSRIIHSLSRKLGLPWHRVVNAFGAVAIREPEGRAKQQALLEAEGVEFSRPGQTDWERFRWNGSGSRIHLGSRLGRTVSWKASSGAYDE